MVCDQRQTGVRRQSILLVRLPRRSQPMMLRTSTWNGTEKWDGQLITYFDAVIQTWWEGDAFAAVEGRCVLNGWWDDIPIQSDFCDHSIDGGQSNIHLESNHFIWMFSSQLLMVNSRGFILNRLFVCRLHTFYLCLNCAVRNCWPESKLDTFCENDNHKKTRKFMLTKKIHFTQG